MRLSFNNASSPLKLLFVHYFIFKSKYNNDDDVFFIKVRSFGILQSDIIIKKSNSIKSEESITGLDFYRMILEIVILIISVSGSEM